MRYLALLVFLLLDACSSVIAGYMPDPHQTPGAINPDVTQSTIGKTICVARWTNTVRPPASYTNRLKAKQLAGNSDRNPRNYEEDHLISLQLGGSPTDPKNLWPQPYAGMCGARTKDVVETKLKRLVCAGKVPLRKAQRAIAGDWVEAYRLYVGPIDCEVMR